MTREDKRMIKLEYFSKLPFWGTYKKNQRIYFLVHGHSSWSTFGLHRVGGTMLSKLILKKSWIMEAKP
jgi:hypothetical protein